MKFNNLDVSRVSNSKNKSTKVDSSTIKVGAVLAYDGPNVLFQDQITYHADGRVLHNPPIILARLDNRCRHGYRFIANSNQISFISRVSEAFPNV